MINFALNYRIIIFLSLWFFLSSFTFKENYSSVYEGLLNEIDEARSCVAREKSNLQRLTLLHAKALKEHNPLISADFNEGICRELNELSNNSKIDTSKNLKNFINQICSK